MTWNTSEGNRVLSGAEGDLVRDVLAIMVDRISENLFPGNDEWNFQFGVGVFDSLSPTEHVAIVKDVAEYLLTQTSDTLELTSINEAAVYAIFRTLAAEIEVEIDEADEPLLHGDGPELNVYWRSRTLRAYRECFDNDLDDEEFANDDPESSWMPPRDEHSPNAEQWDFMTESLADRILWDRDFEMAGDFMDTDPDKAQLLKQMLGIESDYYTSVSADVAPSRIEAALEAVRLITQRKPR